MGCLISNESLSLVLCNLHLIFTGSYSVDNGCLCYCVVLNVHVGIEAAVQDCS